MGRIVLRASLNDMIITKPLSGISSARAIFSAHRGAEGTVERKSGS